MLLILTEPKSIHQSDLRILQQVANSALLLNAAYAFRPWDEMCSELFVASSVLVRGWQEGVRGGVSRVDGESGGIRRQCVIRCHIGRIHLTFAVLKNSVRASRYALSVVSVSSISSRIEKRRNGEEESAVRRVVNRPRSPVNRLSRLSLRVTSIRPLLRVSSRFVPRFVRSSPKRRKCMLP